MSIMAPTPDQVFMGMMQRSSASLPLSCPADSAVSDLGNILEVPAALGRAGSGNGNLPGFGRYWARSSWSSCTSVDNSHLGIMANHSQQQQQQHLGIMPAPFSSSSLLEFPLSFGAGKLYNPGHGAGMGPFSLADLSSLCEPTSGGASSTTVQQPPLLEAVEGITEASTMVGAAAAAAAATTTAAAAPTHGHVEVTQQENTNCNSCCSEHHSGGRGGGSCTADAQYSPARSPSHDSHHAGSGKRKKDVLAPPDPKGGGGGGGEGESVKAKRWCKGDRARDQRSSPEVSTESGSPKTLLVDCKGKAQSNNRPRATSKQQDFIHVRARRGQATDSHSLAERVRREKINERMKFLQDLVPGCKKVTGKAVMLDEIIKYVQSLQRLVEAQRHLAMNLASVNSAQPELSPLERRSLVSNKDMMHSSSSQMDQLMGVVSHHQGGRRLVVGGGGGGQSCGFVDCQPLGSLDFVSSRHNMISSLPSLADGHTSMLHRSFDNNNVSQFSGWDGELQSVVQMGLSHQGLHYQLPVGHMKAEF